MSSRMEKHSGSSVKSRAKKNERLYDQVGDITINYDYIDVDNAVELNPSSNYKSSREDYQKQRELNKILPHQEKSEKLVSEEVIPKEDRIYDINQILKTAKDEDNENLKPNEKQSKRLINTEYNILTKLDIKDLDKDNYRKEDLRSLINDIYKKEEPKKMKNFKRKSENELLAELYEDNDDEAGDLIDDLELKEELSKDILDKNKDDEGTIPITEEIKDLNNEDDKPNNKEIPESYHQEEDEEEMFIFDSLQDKKKIKKEKKNKKEIKKYKPELNEIVKENPQKDEIEYDQIDKDGRGLLIAIIVVVILIILTILFFLYEYFFGV